MATVERERTVRVVSAVVTLVVLGAYLTFGGGPVPETVRSLLGQEDRERAVVTADPEGAYRFLNTQPGSETPVGFSPCRPIRYAVNPLHAPDGWEEQVREAVAEVSDRTGLGFEYEGTTEDRDFDDTVGRSQDREPVLIGWSDEDEVGALADDVAGIGGPAMYQIGNRRYYVGGSVVLDRETTDRYAEMRDGEVLQRALLLHELGHLVGLDHVDDPEELMYPEGGYRVDFGAGDLYGLSRLGAIPCR